MSDALSVADLREIFDADLERGSIAWKRVSKYHGEKVGTEAGTPVPNQSGKVYWVIAINRRRYKRSRIIFALANGRWPTGQVDHVNGISTDDRIGNLREATVTQNAWNHKRRARRINLPMGVRSLASGRYQARIACNKVMHHLGSFATVAEAANVYQQARKEYFGEFA